MGWLRPGMRDRDVVAHALRHDCVIRPLSWFALERRLRPALILGYAAFDEDEIARAVERLACAVNEARKSA